ncbi:MAG: FMN-binding protein [Clostridia bacterium]|nr:FMN-binding protein [Clostridia bacterium]
MKNHIKSILSLTVICAVVTVLLAGTNMLTAPIIEKNQAAAANEALLVVMPDGTDFAAVDLTQYTLPSSVLEAYSEAGGGHVFKLTASGYGPNMIIMCGVDAAGTVTGAVCLSSNETLGHEKTYGESTKGATAETIDSVATISGATMTTENYRNAVKDALNSAIILGGGSVDIRTEEEILADNLAAALPAGDTFTEVFIHEALTDVSAVYTAANGAGSVYVTGEGEDALFVGVGADGVVVSDVDAAIKANIEAQAAVLAASTLTEIDLSQYADMPKQVDKAYKTSGGNYVIETHGSGFGINGDHYYNPSGEYIYVKVALTADGKVINCVTLAQSETDGIGSACADKEFYSQFNGKDETTYKDIDAISGATLTTNGYKSAVSKAFEAVKIMEGVA